MEVELTGANLSAGMQLDAGPGVRVALSRLSDLKGMKVGVRTGMPYGSRVEKAGLNLIKAKTDEANVKKLKAGRIDAFLAYTPDMMTVFQDLGMSPLPHAADKPVAIAVGSPFGHSSPHCAICRRER